MDMNTATPAIQAVKPAAPPPVEPDGRVAADAAAIKKDPTPDIPMPVPVDGTQTALVSKASLPSKDTAPKLDEAGVSSAERTLRPYGISMLPSKEDTADSPDVARSAP